MNQREVFEGAGGRGREIRFSGLVLDPNRLELREVGGPSLRLKQRSFGVLRHLAENAGRIVTKDELLSVCWPGVLVTEDSLTQSISEIRKVLGDDRRDLIRTIPRQGYLLVADVEPPTIAAPAAAAAVPAPDDVVAASDPARASMPRRFLFAAAAALVAVVAVVAALVSWPDHRPAGPATVAILPFTNDSGRPDLDYFARGTTTELASQFARAPLIRTVTTSPTADAADPVGEGRAVGADFVVVGSVSRNAHKVRLIAQLVDVSTGHDVWGERFDRQSEDPLQMQDALVGAVVKALAGERGILQRQAYQDAWGKETVNLEEYDYYLRGHDVFYNYTKSSLEEANRIWRDGLKKFPDSALLKIKLGFGLAQLVYIGAAEKPAENFDEAYRLGTEALSKSNLTPLERAMGNWLMANLEMDRNLDTFKAAMHSKIAMELLPGEPEIRILQAWLPIVEGRPADALAMLDGFNETSPNANYGFANRAWAYYALKDYPRAIDAALKAGDEYGYALPILAAAYVESGRLQDAEATVARIRALTTDCSLAYYGRYHRTRDEALNRREQESLRRAGLS